MGQKMICEKIDLMSRTTQGFLCKREKFRKAIDTTSLPVWVRLLRRVDVTFLFLRGRILKIQKTWTSRKFQHSAQKSSIIILYRYWKDIAFFVLKFVLSTLRQQTRVCNGTNLTCFGDFEVFKCGSCLSPKQILYWVLPMHCRFIIITFPFCKEKSLICLVVKSITSRLGNNFSSVPPISNSHVSVSDLPYRRLPPAQCYPLSGNNSGNQVETPQHLNGILNSGSLNQDNPR